MSGPAPSPKTVVDAKSAAAVEKAAEREASAHEQDTDGGLPVSTGAVKAEVGVTVEFAGTPGVEIRVKPEDLPEDARPKTSTDTGRGPSVKVVASPAKSEAKPATRSEHK